MFLTKQLWCYASRRILPHGRGSTDASSTWTFVMCNELVISHSISVLFKVIYHLENQYHCASGEHLRSARLPNQATVTLADLRQTS
jgi:hypothetical protein